MDRKFLNFYLALSVLFFLESFSNSSSLANEALAIESSPDGSRGNLESKIVSREGVGFLSVNDVVDNAWSLLCPLAELLAKDTIKAVVLLLGGQNINMRLARTYLTDLQKLKKIYGKPIVAYTESMLSAEDYVVACGADAIVVAPLTKVGGIGYRWQYDYCFEKDKKDQKVLNFIYSGKFKDISMHLSPKPEHIKIFEQCINKAYGELVKEISDRRPNAGINKEKWIQGNWFNAKEALSLGLVDCIADQIDLIGYVTNLAGCSYLNLTNTELFIKKEVNDSSFVHTSNNQRAHAGVLKIDQLTSNSIWDYGHYLLELFKDESVDKIILYISSCGGELESSLSFHSDVLKLKQMYKKPVIAYLDVALSGGYLIATAADYIIAGPGARVGSVGVCLERWDFTNKNKNDQVKVVSVSTGKSFAIKDTSIVLDTPTKEFLQKQLTLTHAKFIQLVKLSRPNLKNNEVHWAEAQKFIAHDALYIGLIDAIGTPLDAISYGNQDNDETLSDFNLVFKSIAKKNK